MYVYCTLCICLFLVLYFNAWCEIKYFIHNTLHEAQCLEGVWNVDIPIYLMCSFVTPGPLIFRATARVPEFLNFNSSQIAI